MTLVADGRAPIFSHDITRKMLYTALENCRKYHPFELDAIVILPDHLHMLITLPNGDSNFSIRINNIKSSFTRAYGASGMSEQPRSASRIRQRSRGVWLKRFWEHTIRDVDDLNNHFDYIHYNPVKHGLVDCAHAWAHSSFGRFVKENRYQYDWCCQCHGRSAPPQNLDEIAASAGE